MLETDRLLLEAWQPEDWTSFRPIATDPEVMRYITGGEPWSDDEIRGFIGRQIDLYAQRGYCRWKLIEKASGRLIGFCGVGYWRALDPEIGWWLERASWGRGIASEAARVALRDAFDRSDLDRIVSVARPENTASIRIMCKLGLTFDREWIDQGVRLVRYAITRAEFTTAASIPS